MVSGKRQFNSSQKVLKKRPSRRNGIQMADSRPDQESIPAIMLAAELIASQAVDHMADSVMLVDMNGTIIYVNKSFERLLGYSADELVGTSALDLPTYRGSKDREKARQALRDVIKTGCSESNDISAVTRSGKEIALSFSASVMKDGEGSPRSLVAVVRDMTKRKLAERELRQSEEHFRALVENSLDGSSIVNEDLTIRYESPSVERILGYSPEELIGKNTLQFLHEEDARNVTKTLDILKQRPGKAIRMEVRFLHKDGSWRVIEGVVNNKLEDPSVKGIVVNYRDITIRKEIEEALKGRETHLLALIENSMADMSVLNADGVIRYQSPSIRGVLGYKPEEHLGKSSLDFVHPDDKPETAERFAKLVSEPGSSLTFEVRVKHKCGSWRILEVFGRNLLHDPVISGILASFRDVTERKLAEQERVEHAAALARAAELQRSRQRIVTVQESVRRDVAQMLHGSVQNRLIVLLHRLAGLEQSIPNPELAREVSDIRAKLSELLENQVRSISHRLYPSILRRGLVAALQSLVDQFENTMEIDMNFDGELVWQERENPQFIVEQVRLAAYRIAEEALTNAVKHAGASRMSIGARLVSGELLEVTVKNDGQGFDATRSSGGLGVMMMQDYAEVAGGRCYIHSAPDRGTEVKIVVPVAAPAVAPLEKASPSE